jgi:hypothetical protein
MFACPAVQWHSRVHKMRVMRIAWSGVLLHSRYELLRGGMSAFKANWREEQLHRRMVTAAFLAWRELMDRNKAAAAVRSRTLDVSHRIAGSANSYHPTSGDKLALLQHSTESTATAYGACGTARLVHSAHSL